MDEGEVGRREERRKTDRRKVKMDMRVKIDECVYCGGKG